MSRAFVTRSIVLIAISGAVASASASITPIDFGEPAPAKASTATLAIASGRGARRLAIWTARNARDEICLGWRTGASTAAPAKFTCLRRGLEPPVVAVEHGGGVGGVSTWGVAAGIASRRVARVEAETLFGSRTARDLKLRVARGTSGWRVFTSGAVPHPTSQELNVYDAAGRLIARPAVTIHPAAPTTSGSQPAGVPPGIPTVTAAPPQGPGAAQTGPAWNDTASSLPPSRKADTRAITIALADPVVQSIVSNNAAWIETVATWFNCSGRSLGRVVGFRFMAPASFAATLPSVGPPAGRFSYSQATSKVRATDWRTMSVWVDANDGAVVGVAPLGPSLPGEGQGGTTTIATVTPPRDAGGTDSGDCWHSSG